MTVRTVAMLTAGGLAPCLSSAVGGLIERYTEVGMSWYLSDRDRVSLSFNIGFR